MNKLEQFLVQGQLHIFSIHTRDMRHMQLQILFVVHKIKRFWSERIKSVFPIPRILVTQIIIKNIVTCTAVTMQRSREMQIYQSR
jgi:hypothetical protein